MTISTPTPNAALRGFVVDARSLPARDSYPPSVRATIVCGSTVVELYGEELEPLIGMEPGTPITVLADIRSSRATIEGRQQPSTVYRFRARSVSFDS